MKQGTVSILFGCHSIIHSYYVYKSWKILYKQSPCFYETVCIFLHDIGHFNKNYLNNIEEKKQHWILGANIAKKLFGQKGYDLCAGHCEYSKVARNCLYYADKYSWYIASYYWLFSNNIFEPQLLKGMNNFEACVEFKNKVKSSIESGSYSSTHSFYLERKERKIK